MNIKSNILIVSVFQKSKTTEQNLKAHDNLMSSLKADNIPHLSLLGQYEGIKELSVLIKGFEYRGLVETIAKNHNQECYLESHNDRATFLVYADGRRDSIGTLTPVSKAEAESMGNFSYDRVAGQYFVTR